MKTAIITGVSGQDGAYLANFFLEKGYKVIGVIRPNIKRKLLGLGFLGIQEKVSLQELDMLNKLEVEKLLNEYHPD